MINRLLILSVVILLSAQLVAAQEIGTVSAIKANLRGTPSASGLVITTVTNGETFEVIKSKAPWYLVQTEKYVGWIHGNGIKLDELPDLSAYAINPTTPTKPQTTVPADIVRYPTGTNLIIEENTGGRGSLQITNGTGSDSIAKLADSRTNRTVRLVYIQANSVATITNIRDGNYVLKFSLGSGYDRATAKFTRAQNFSRFDEILDFYETRVGNSIRWKDFEVTLNPVVGGNASTSPISAADFEGP